jgi:hypothetical protein
MFLRVAGPLCIAAAFVCSGDSFAWAASVPSQATIVAQASPRPTPSAAPTATPAPKRLTIGVQGYLSAINQQFVGPGIVPPEGAGFAAGSPIAPGTPYDFFSNAPLTTGFGFHQGLVISPTLHLKGFDVTADVGYGSISGSGNVAEYWGEQPLPQLNVHLGQRQINVPPAFTTHNSQDGIKGGIVGVDSGKIATTDGNVVLRGGWIDLLQSEKHVFAPPPMTNSPASLGVTLPETIGDGAPVSDNFPALSSTLPLHGLDLTVKRGIGTFEATDADLPTLPGTAARLESVSMELDHGAGLKYGAQVVHVKSGGDPVAITLLWGGVGGPGFLIPSSQGNVPISLLGGQKTTIFGADASIPLGLADDFSAKYGYSTYSATGTAFAAQAMGGSFYSGKFHHAFNSWEATVEGLRFEPGYAPMQIPYGTLENVWSIAYSWPATWLKSFYPLADVSEIGPNRQGLRFSANTIFNKIDVRVMMSEYQMIHPYDIGNAFTPGFVEGYFLPQLNGGATIGKETHAAAALAWHPKAGDFNLELTDATLGRAGANGNPADAVAMNYPGGTFSFARPINPRLYGSIGAGRYAVDGSFANSGPKNADLAESVIFAGLQYSKDPKSVYHLQYRLYSVKGIPTIPGGPSPNMHGPQLILEQRFKV